MVFARLESVNFCLSIVCREKIFGYENLRIKVYFISGSLETYMAMEYKRKISQKLTDGVEVSKTNCYRTSQRHYRDTL